MARKFFCLIQHGKERKEFCSRYFDLFFDFALVPAALFLTINLDAKILKYEFQTDLNKLSYSSRLTITSGPSFDPNSKF